MGYLKYLAKKEKEGFGFLSLSLNHVIAKIKKAV